MTTSTLCSAGRIGRPFSLSWVITPIVSAIVLLLCASQPVTAQSITLLYPNGGESFTGNSSVTVRWNATGLADEEVDVEYSPDGGAKWRRIGRTTAGAGQIGWTVDNKPSTTVLARVVTRKGGIGDQSDNVFEIKEDPLSLTLMLAPNGGEIWTEGETQQIRWQAPPDAINVTLELSTNSGLAWSEIATLPAGMASYSWTVPHLSDQEILTALMKITITEAPDHFDQSDAPFTLRPKQVVLIPRLTLLQPNGGETFGKDSTVTIAWNSENATGQMEIQYTTDGGVNWQKIDRTDVAAGTFLWKVPGTPTVNGVMRIIMADGSAEDRSDAPFTIVNPALKPITLIAPNGGEIWDEGEQHAIQWQAPGDVGMARIEYSLDGGATWTGITSIQANLGTYDWRIPRIADTVITETIVRITDEANPTRFVQSASPFTVNPIPRVSGTPAVSGEREGSISAAILSLSSIQSTGEILLTWRQDRAGAASVTLHDLTGRTLLEAETEGTEAGEHRISIFTGLQGSNPISSGSYFCTLRIGKTTTTRGIIIIR